MRRKVIRVLLLAIGVGATGSFAAVSASGQRCGVAGMPDCPGSTPRKPAPKPVSKPATKPAQKPVAAHPKRTAPAPDKADDGDTPSAPVKKPRPVNPRAEAKLEECERHNANANYDQAINACTAAINLDQSDPIAYYRRGFAEAKTGREIDAIKDLSEAIRLQPDLEEALYRRGYIYYNRKQYEEAIADFQGALRKDHPDPGTGKADEAGIYYDGLIKAYFAVASYDLALPIAEKYMKYLPTRSEPYRLVGICLLNLGRYDEAVSQFDEALKRGPEPSVRGKIEEAKAEAKKTKQDLIDKIETAKQRVKLNNDAASLSELAQVYRSQDKLDLAIDSFSQAAELEPKDPAIYLERGKTYVRKGSFDLAITDLDKVLKLNSYNKNVYLERGRAFAGKGELDRAIEDLTQFIKLKPGEPDGYLERGGVYALKGETKSAIADFTDYISRAPDEPIGYLKRAQAYDDLGDRKSSEADRQTAKEKKAERIGIKAN